MVVAILLVGCGSGEPVDGLQSSEAAAAIRMLNAHGHQVDVSDAGLTGAKGHVCLLTGQAGGIRSEDAKLLSQVPDLVEIRVIPVGGPPVEFWNELSQIDSLRDFAAHYGLTEEGIRSLSKFPNLRTLTIWGRSTSLEQLPALPHLRLLHIEETQVKLKDIRQVKESCPALKEFLCDNDLEPEALELLRTIPTLKNISAGGFHIGKITGQ